ncbi:hypothetical protein L249_6437 [Ophiocordyceps polyrhachis-furcata BCC 54312]|uniref:Vacuolar calcium ion transporter n=1 Tax=Ophiocordyceps polyrhachis-furcata BCC 54312 TaxID=1330021 RepID=A0A367LJR8_9HYPO|nr:hypothetical protein L249_6437 [Ophiocordyceps polyrhachis-furcata BCC 54312]
MGPSSKPTRGPPHEGTALLPHNGGPSSAPAPHLHHHGHHPIIPPPSVNGWNAFFFDQRQTPGRDSDRLAIRICASLWHVTKVTLLSNYVNLLLVTVPLGIVAGALAWSPVVVFTLNFLAIIPLAAVLSFATEEIAAKLGEALGGLLSATFGNAVELIVSVIALKDGQIEVVQSSMLGSILSNLLLVMGTCFLLGGLRHRGSTGHGTEQKFAKTAAQTTCSLMTLSSASLVLPAALYAVMDKNGSHGKKMQHSILVLSHGTAVLLLLLYIVYLTFQLRTHSNLFEAESQNGESGLAHNGQAHSGQARNDQPQNDQSQNHTSLNVTNHTPEDDDDDDDDPEIGPISASAVLIITTVVVAICAQYLVGSIDAIVATQKISKTFIGLILIPIVGNAAEHVTAVVVAMQDKMDLAMGVAIGSSIQIALGLTPFLVIVGWIIGQPMSLHFETFATVAFAISVLVSTYVIQDGKSNYLEGAMLLGLYLIIAVAFFVTPGEALRKLSAVIRV